MSLPIPLTLEPMEAEPIDALPEAAGWSFEPKYDGFRCVVFRDGDSVLLQSRRQRPLARFFPEVAAAVAALAPRRFVLDGELVIRGAGFDALQLRLHPAASRIARLSRETPATFVAFDMLADTGGDSLLARPFAERRAALQEFPAGDGIAIAESTRSRDTALRWLKDVGHGLDGIVAKRLDLPYRPGERAMLKYKLWHTIDCVVGGVYRKAGSEDVEYLLLGLYDSEGRLNYVGRCPAHPHEAAYARKLRPLAGSGGFTGNQPGGRSRWSKQERIATPLRPEQVVEVSVDTITAGKFRHGSRLLRWRTDKAPHQCTMDQIARR
ncbi:MAG TPA: ATP-dependent DNA ligase [Acetobacteraceae bacterium]|nr:ATP-dependent DNA ligase [Acetobacteraceae bacterium]